MSKKYVILILEDDAEDLSSLKQVFRRLNSTEVEFETTFAKTCQEAINLLEVSEFDLILADLELKDKKGVELIRTLLDTTKTIPIITTSIFTEEERVREVIRMGAQEYLPKKELDPEHLLRSIYNAIERHSLRENLRSQIFTDELTNVYNRRGFMTFLKQQVSFAQRSRQGFYLLVIDVDFLKKINDSYGHPVGDQALIDVAQSLHHAFRSYDIIGRIGGDEFAVIAINAAAASREQLIKNIQTSIQKLNEARLQPYHLSVSIGGVYYNGKEEVTVMDLLSLSDLDLYIAKKLAHEE